jgi:hypothetical protein
MKKTVRPLLSEVQEKIEHRTPGYASWFKRLPKDAQEECLAVRDAFQRGELGCKAAVARALMAAAKERGWVVAKEKQVTTWLVEET